MEKDRKKDHIELTLKSKEISLRNDPRFFYEPLLGKHPTKNDKMKTSFLGKSLDYPIWISSMTGGTREAKNINQNLAKLANEYRLGMGIGSCRTLLESKERFEEFNVREILGNDLPFFANLGISQIEEIVAKKEIKKVSQMVNDLNADGLIIHINPLQEWLQVEGDRLKVTPFETLKDFLSYFNLPVIVKEVGQGMGPKSLESLMKLNIKGIEFGAFGGTNFSLIEAMRNEGDIENLEKKSVISLGHTFEEMFTYLNNIDLNGKEFIVSGGIQTSFDGYYAIEKMRGFTSAIYGMGGALLPYARKSYEDLKFFMEEHLMNLKLANQFLKIRDDQNDK